jgi:hypothetical protein
MCSQSNHRAHIQTGRVDLLMNNRGEDPQIPEMEALQARTLGAQVPLQPLPGSSAGTDISPKAGPRSHKKNGLKTCSGRESVLLKDSLFVLKRKDVYHIISESYYYKTDPYYTILRLELEGKKVEPSSSAVLDAYVIPICLERAASAGIPICEWGISQVYVPLPAILYGLNYFSTTLDYFIVDDSRKAKDVIKHITNNGKYPFCYQRYPDGAEIHTCTAIFGLTVGACTTVADYASRIYEIFRIPLVKLVFVNTGGTFALSSLSPTRYAQLSDGERALLSAYLSNQEFL